MKLLLINAVLGYGSTGKIVLSIAREYEEKGYEVKAAHGRFADVTPESEKYGIRIGSMAGVYLHAVYSALTDRHGLGSKAATRKFLKWAEEYDPDVLWIHNVHGYYINYEMLFDWIKSRPQMEVKWTLHDCWAFTGHCSHFTYVKCNKWKQCCENCPQKSYYPKSILFDRSRQNYLSKKKAFTGVKNMTIITPSDWLKGLVKESFLSEYPVEVRYNTVDTNTFQPRQSDFKDRYGIADKKMVLGVATNWNKKKGLDDFLELALMLPEDYQVVFVGLLKDQIKKLPEGVIGIQNVKNPVELSEIYSAADFFVNPSYEETFGLTTVEAISCGTKAIVYSGSASEEIAAKYGGIIVSPGAANIYDAIMRGV